MLNLPKPESQRAIHMRVARALEQRLRIVIQPVTREDAAYILTISNPARFKLAETPDEYGGHIGSVSATFSIPSTSKESPSRERVEQILQQMRENGGIALDSLDMSGSTEDLCRALEDGMHRPVLDRTGYSGTFRLTIERQGGKREQLFHAIEQQYGLAIRPATAQVEHLSVKHNR